MKRRVAEKCTFQNHMIRMNLITLFFACGSMVAQRSVSFLDSVRIKYKIPEMAYAVISEDSVYEMQVIGERRRNSGNTAGPTDRFRIGSNTKAVTGFIAAQLVNEKRIRWDTKFFELFADLRRESNPVYHDLTLIDLLSFRTRLYPYTYTDSEPVEDQFEGDDDQQRSEFTRWFFKLKPVENNIDHFHFSNVGYTAAGMMLEKVSGKKFKDLVKDLGKQLNIEFEFGAPNTNDTLQTWGHDNYLNPEPPFENYKMNWLLAAGNINVSLPDYIKFIQLQLRGLNGRSTLLAKEQFEFLHFGLPRFAVGWFWATDEVNNRYSFNVGNPGTFLSKVYVFPNNDRAFIFFSNVQSSAADEGIDRLYEIVKRKYLKPGESTFRGSK
jgi:CubicO group peptidase (beta-lactamase class C family)